MKKHFYSHIIHIDTIHKSLDDLGIPQEEKDELIILVESSVHHVVLDIVLSHLKDDHKKKLIEHVTAEEREKAWELVTSVMHNAEAKIKLAVDKLIDKLHEDIAEVKNKKID